MECNLDDVKIEKVPLRISYFEDAPDLRALRVEDESGSFEVRPIAYTEEARALIRELTLNADR